jgi:hypothetical protein
MNLKYSINLDNYYPLEIIELHKQGLISIEEIKASGRIRDSFGNDLAEYVRDVINNEVTRVV